MTGAGLVRGFVVVDIGVTLRAARRALREDAILALPRWRRAFAAHVLRHLERGSIVDRNGLRDIGTFLGILRNTIAAGMHAG